MVWLSLQSLWVKILMEMCCVYLASLTFGSNTVTDLTVSHLHQGHVHFIYAEFSRKKVREINYLLIHFV